MLMITRTPVTARLQALEYFSLSTPSYIHIRCHSGRIATWHGIHPPYLPSDLPQSRSGFDNLLHLVERRELVLVWRFREVADLSDVDAGWSPVVLCITR